MKLNLSSEFSNLIIQDHCSEEDVAEVLKHRKDRAAFLQWAAQAMPIIHQNPCLTRLHKKILAIDSSYAGAKVYQAVKNVLDHLRSFVIQQPPASDDEQVSEALRTLVLHSTFSRTKQKRLLTLINERQDERLLLQYLAPEEKEGVLMAQTNLLEIDRIAELVALGQWEKLFAHDPTDSRELSYLLIAAYLLRRIDLDDLATAMLFHRVCCNTERAHLRLVPITSDTLDEMLNLSRVEKAQILAAAAQAATPNQRTLIMVEQEAIDPYTRNLIVKSFINRPIEQRIPGFFQSETMVGMPAFGLAKALYPNLTPVIHLAPTAEAMADHVRNGLSDFVLLFPDEAPIVHGSQDKTIFAPLHDLFHTYARNKRPMQQGMMKCINTIQQAPELGSNYQGKLTNGIGTLYPQFHTRPTVTEMTGFLLERVIGEIIDGSYACTSYSYRAILRDIVERVSEEEFTETPEFFPQDMREEILKQVHRRCSISGNSFYIPSTI